MRNKNSKEICELGLGLILNELSNELFYTQNGVISQKI
jgi:hypothetical protein